MAWWLIYFIAGIPLGNYLKKKKGWSTARAYLASTGYMLVGWLLIVLILQGLGVHLINVPPNNPTSTLSVINQTCNVAKTYSSATTTIEGPGAHEFCNELINMNPNIGLYLATYNLSYQGIVCSVKVENLTFTIRDADSDGFEGGYLCRSINNIKNGYYPTSATSTPSPTIQLYYYAIVNVDYSNIRSGPGLNYSINATATRGQKLLITGNPPFGNWIQLSQGWIYAPAVQVVKEFIFDPHQ